MSDLKLPPIKKPRPKAARAGFSAPAAQRAVLDANPGRSVHRCRRHDARSFAVVLDDGSVYVSDRDGSILLVELDAEGTVVIPEAPAEPDDAPPAPADPVEE